MRRLLGLVLTAFAGLAAVVAILGARADSADTYRVDAIFDTAKGVIPGQLVKIAGARVGTIEDVQLTKDYKARIIMDVPRRFTFREDASCDIQPEGLISENFVQCVPGTPGKPDLKGEGETGVPTVPVERTMVPVSITDLFRIFQADIRQRFTVAIAAVGGGLAARGPEINDIMRRASPTLMAVRRLTSDLADQKDQLSSAVRDTDKVVAALAARKGRVQDFIVQAQRVTAQTADHSSALADAVRRLPPLLDDTDTAVGNLNRLTREGRPLLGQLRAAAPGLERVVDNLSPFADAARPALRQLSDTADIGRATIKPARPLVALLRRFARDATPVGRTLNTALINLRDRGFVENLNLFAYYAAAATARYDSISHIFPAHVLLSTCSTFAETPTAGCNAFYGDREPGPATPVRKRRSRSGAEPVAPAPPTAPSSPDAPAPAAPGAPDSTPAPQGIQPLQDLTDTITGNVQKALPRNQQTLDDLADFLFKK